ncbi:hypothetical protein C3L33_06402, partial [Rhododendron williamsianum]
MSLFACCRMDRSDSIKGSSVVYAKSHQKEKKNARKYDDDDQEALATIVRSISMRSGSIKQRKLAEEILKFGKVKVAAEVFTFRQLATATNNFNADLLLGEGGFGRVYKGHIRTTSQPVAVKQLDKNGVQGNREFLAEVLTLSLVNHPNLVNLIGYCADGHQRILAAPLLKDRRKCTLMADPRLEGNYPEKGLYQALAVAAMCLQDEASTRPLICDVVTALEYLARP